MKVNDLIGSAVESRHAEEGDGQAMVVDAEGHQFLLRTLINLYSNPNAAVLREITSNALDSHVKAGTDKAVEVSFPNYGPGELIIRDYGVGLSQDELMFVYGTFGGSDKRNSNTQIGGFGLGAKSPLAITDRYTITAWKDGVQSNAYVAKNEEGSGRFYFVDSEPSSEPNGVKISIPIPSGEPFRALVRDDFFIGWAPGSILVEQVAPAKSLWDESKFTRLYMDDEIIGFVGKSSTSSPYSFSSSVKSVLGGITYNISMSDNGYSRDLIATLDRLGKFKREVYLNLPLGSVAMTPAREDLSYVPRTIRTITAVASAFEETLIESVEEELNLLPDFQSAAVAALKYKEDSYFAPLKYRNEVFPEEVTLSDKWSIISYHPTSKNKLSVGKGVNGKGTGIKISTESLFKQGSVVLSSSDVEDVQKVKTSLSSWTSYILRTEGPNNSYDFSGSTYGRNVTVYLFSGDKSEVKNNWLAAKLNRSTTVQRIREEASAQRKFDRANKSKKVVVDDGEPQVTVPREILVHAVTRTNNGWVAQQVTKESLDGKKVAYFQRASSTSPALNHALPGSFRSISTPMYGHKDIWGLLKHKFPEYVFVILASNRSVKKFQSDFPEAVDGVPFVEKAARGFIEEFPASNLDADGWRAFDVVYYRYNDEGRQLHATKSIFEVVAKDEEIANLITSDSTREMVKRISLATKKVSETSSPLLSSAYYWLNTPFPKPRLDSDEDAKAVAEEFAEFFRKYVLTVPNTKTSTLSQHYIPYVNIVDAS